VSFFDGIFEIAFAVCHCNDFTPQRLLFGTKLRDVYSLLALGDLRARMEHTISDFTEFFTEKEELTGAELERYGDKRVSGQHSELSKELPHGI